MFQECHHIKVSGGKCHSPALRGQPYCYFHARRKEHATEPKIESIDPLSKQFANLEDRGAIQNAITHIATALADYQIDPRRARILLYALQIASSNGKQPRSKSANAAETTHPRGTTLKTSINPEAAATHLEPRKEPKEHQNLASFASLAAIETPVKY